MIQHKYILEEDGLLPAGAHNGTFIKVDGDFVIIECDCDENKEDSGYQADELLGNSTLEAQA